MTLQRQIYFWLAALAALILFLLAFREVLLPFVAGMALAYCLDPMADWLERSGFSRMAATVTILSLFVLLFILALVLVLPILGHQLASFLQNLPDYIAALQKLIAEQGGNKLLDLIGRTSESSQPPLADLVSQGTKWLGTLLQKIWSGGQALMNVVALFVVTPIVAFYLLYDWDHMVEKVDSWVPRDHVGTIRELGAEINGVLAGFIRGQGTVSLALGTYYAIALSLVGLNFGLLIGLFSGLLGFIPYVGSGLGLILSMGVALVQFWPDYVSIGLVALIFVSGQFFEGNFLQPKLVGESVGLHPVWLMFALVAFGYAFGFVGMMVAIPVASAIGVLSRFALRQYMESPIYLGRAGKPETGKETDGEPQRETGQTVDPTALQD